MTIKRVCDLSAEFKLNDVEFIDLYAKVGQALTDAFGKVDSGMGGGWADFWIRQGDVEYKLVMKPHRLLKESS